MHSMTINERSFKEIIDQHSFVIVLFTASWCEPCKLFEPIFDAEALHHGAIMFTKIDIDEHPYVADYFNIQHVPTLLAIRNEIIVDGTHGAMTAGEFSQLILLWKGINTTEINRHFAKKQTLPSQIS